LLKGGRTYQVLLSGLQTTDQNTARKRGRGQGKKGGLTIYRNRKGGKGASKTVERRKQKKEVKGGDKK